MGDPRMSDDPFAEPDDSDKTVIRPAPGGGARHPPPRTARRSARPGRVRSARRRRRAAPARPSAFENMAPPPVTGGAETIQFGLNPLVQPPPRRCCNCSAACATPSPAPNVEDLRERTVRQVRQFEQAARDAGVPNEQLRPAHYALCASIDDVVLNTPWGSQGGWAARSLVSTFHQETRSGERFFRILEDLKQNRRRPTCRCWN